jgi:tripartite-type tricarboxylate transporter receptor subunit TctC
MPALKTIALLAALGIAALSTQAAGDDAVLPAGPIKLIVGYGPGGGYDAYARLAADHLGKFLPGHPVVVVENMEGGGGRRSEVFLAGAAPKDGSVIGLVPNSFAADSAEKLISGDVDAATFGFIGRLASGSDVEITWKSSPTKTVEDALVRETIVGADGVGGNSSVVPRVLNAILGTKFKVVEGYKGTADAALAMQRGEVEGIIFPLQTLQSLHPDWLETGTAVNILWVQAPIRNPGFPNVPSLLELARDDDQRAMLGVLCATGALGRSLTTPPGVPAETIAVFRKAFDAMAKDSDFQADAVRRKLPIDYASGADVAAIVKQTMDTPPATLARLEQILKSD